MMNVCLRDQMRRCDWWGAPGLNEPVEPSASAGGAVDALPAAV